MAKVKEFEYEYNPIKEQKGNKEAQAVVWTTKSLEIAIEGMNRGLELKVNPFCGKNTRLLKPDLVYKRTKEEVDDYIKCMQDPCYFGTKLEIMTPEGLQRVQLRDYQEEYLRHLQNHRFSIWLAVRQVGKSVTTAIAALHKALFNPDKNVLILSKSAAAGLDLIKKIQDMVMSLEPHLRPGILKWNQSSIAFDNNSVIQTCAFGPTAGLGMTINFLILDEFAWCPPNEVELFYNNIIPTVTTISDSNVCIMSTQNGFNLFYKIWNDAITGKNMYAPFKVDWYQVPQFNPETKQWEKRTEKWKEMMIGILGGIDEFNYQYSCVFAVSSACLVKRDCIARFRNNDKKFTPIADENNYHSLNSKELFIKPDYDIQQFKNKHYVILVDLAEGGGGDYTIFNILEIVGKDKFEQVAYWRSNTTDIEHAALEFWLMFTQLFNAEKTLISIEWNTYGALFYNYLMNLNETDYMPEHSWRFRYGNELDMNSIIYYKKGANEEDIAGLNIGVKGKMIPGIRFNGSNKVTACALLKMMLENNDISICDMETLRELENFEDKNGSGTYKASSGHDDLIMTFCQVPMLMQTSKYKFFMEEIEGIIKTEQRKNLIEDKFESVDFYNANQQVPNLFDTEQDSGLFAVPQASNLFGANPFIQQQFNDSGIGGSGFTSLY